MNLRYSMSGLCLALVCQFTNLATVAADVVVYNVDLSGTDTNSGHTLGVAGTIMADTATNTIVSNTLNLFHNGVAQIGFDIPTETGSGFAWNATLSELRFERVSGDTGSYRWLEPGPPLYWFELGSGATPHSLLYDPDASGNAFDFVELFPAGGPSSPGFLVGTSGVPEPSTFVILALAGIAGIGARRRRP